MAGDCARPWFVYRAPGRLLIRRSDRRIKESCSANMLGNELSPQNVIEKSRKVVIFVGVSPSAESTDTFIAGDSSECLRGLPEGTDESSAHSFRIGKSDRASNDFDRLRAFLDLKPGDLGT
jgi:hypothetical protein